VTTSEYLLLYVFAFSFEVLKFFPAVGEARSRRLPSTSHISHYIVRRAIKMEFPTF
jgi:hypothetical protein